MNIFTSDKRLPAFLQRIFTSSVVATLAFLMLLANCSILSSNTVVKEDTLRATLGNLAIANPNMTLGVSVVRLKDKKALVAHNDRKLFIPASTAKLLTMASALHYLGPQYRYDTKLYTQKREHSTKLQYLYLKASGDPSFSSLDIAKLVTELKQLGVRKVSGDIVIDATVFDDVHYGKGWLMKDLKEGYSAPISGISIDHNKVAFGIFAGTQVKEPTRLTVFPNTNYFTLVNKIQTGTAASAYKLDISTGTPTGITRDLKVVLEGNVSASMPVKYETIAINDPSDFAGFVLMEELAKNGIAFSGKLTKGKVPENAQLITHHVSATLAELLFDLAKYSDNHAAESLVKTIAVKQSGAPGTFENGLLAIRQFLEQKAGLELGGVVNADGSGLSRYNQLSAKHLTDLLTFMWSNYRIGPEFVGALARFGDDNSLVRAKTGTMQNIRGLAGYLPLANGDVVAFAILTNGSASSPKGSKPIIDAILTTIKAL